MDTGGKIATGVIVPLAVGGAAVAAYYGIKIMGERQRKKAIREEGNAIQKRISDTKKIDKYWDDALSDKDGGKRRRTRRRR